MDAMKYKDTDLSRVVFASFPSSFLSWSTPMIKLPILPTLQQRLWLIGEYLN